MMPVMPHSIESENCVIGSLIVDPESIHLIDLSPEDFFSEKNRAAFTSLKKMSSSSLDQVTIQVNLKSMGIVSLFEECSVWTDMAPSSAMIEHHANIVKKLASKRAMIQVGQKLMEGSLDEDPKIAATMAIEQLSGAKSLIVMKNAPHCFEFLEEFLSSERDPVITTGLTKLDEGMEGGLHIGGTLMVGGDSGAGKTMLVLGFVRTAVKKMIPTFIVSRDQTEKDIMAKIFAGCVGISRAEMKGDERASSMKEITRDWPLWFYPREERFDVDSICNRIKIAVAAHGVKVWIVDYIQRIDLDGCPELRSDHARIEKIGNKLSDIAQETKTAGIIISKATKPNREVATQHRFSGGAGLQNACDDMLWVHQYDFTSEERAQLFGKGGVRMVELIGKRNFTKGFVDLKVDYPYDRYKEWKNWSFNEQEAWNAERRS